MYVAPESERPWSAAGPMHVTVPNDDGSRSCLYCLARTSSPAPLRGPCRTERTDAAPPMSPFTRRALAGALPPKAYR